jgi:uncharacterized protein
LTRDSLCVRVRVSPRARADRLLAVSPTPEGGCLVKAAVTAPAERGRANEALLQLLARAWDLPRRDLSIVAGMASRRKTVRIAGDPQRLLAVLTGKIAILPSG